MADDVASPENVVKDTFSKKSLEAKARAGLKAFKIIKMYYHFLITILIINVVFFKHNGSGSFKFYFIRLFSFIF